MGSEKKEIKVLVALVRRECVGWGRGGRCACIS